MTTEKTRYVGVKYDHDKMVAHSPKRKYDWTVHRWFRDQEGWWGAKQDKVDHTLWRADNGITFRVVQLDE